MFINVNFKASGAIKRSVHEDNQPVDGSVEAVNATLGKGK
jgi:hypothetical protein